MGTQWNIRTVHRSLVVVALAVLLAACGTAQATPPAADGPVVELRDDQFHPTQLEVPAGTMVTWWWNDGRFGGHDLMSDAFSAPEQTRGTFSHRFETPGTYTYLCTLHTGMTGTIVVTAAGAAATP